MQYTVVHSKDPYLLARLATDLQMSGFEPSEWINYSDKNVFNNFDYIKTYVDNLFDFFNDSYGTVVRNVDHELTSSNYIKVLTQILEP
jgi:hypothetical protein